MANSIFFFLLLRARKIGAAQFEKLGLDNATLPGQRSCFLTLFQELAGNMYWLCSSSSICIRES